MKSTFFIGAILLCGIIHAEEETSPVPLTIYKTYSDYKDGKGTDKGMMENYTYASTPVGNTFSFVLAGEKKFKPEEMWGFKAGDDYFLMYQNLPVKIVSVGKYAYFENGLMHLSLMLYGDAIVYDNDILFYYAKDLVSTVYSHSKVKKFIKECPDFAPAYKCYLDGKFRGIDARLIGMRNCTAQYNN